MFYKITHDFFISDSTNKGLIKALGDGTPIFKENGGKYDVYNVDDYLSHFDLLKNYLDEGIVPEKDIYDSYSYYIVQAYQNKEIWEYVTGLRRDYKDSTFYANVELLAKRFIEENKKQIYSH
jgi:predicted choloylglycine hydrolase